MKTIYHCDCIQGSKKYIQNESIDLIITDPPYNLNYFGTTQTKSKKPRFTKMDNDHLTDRKYLTFTYNWLKEAYRVLKPRHHIYVFIDWRMYPYLALMMKKVGFVIKNCVVWDKVHFGLGWQYRFKHEFIIFAAKGNQKVRRIRSRGTSDILHVPKIPGSKLSHAAEKPLELIQKMILNSSEEGERVADFFLGSGVVAEAAVINRREIVGFETVEKNYNLIQKRLNKEGIQYD